MTILGYFCLDTIKDILSVVIFKRAKEQRVAEAGMRRWRIRKRIPIIGWFVGRKADKKRRQLTWMQRTQAAMTARGIRWLATSKSLDDITILVSPNLKPKANPAGPKRRTEAYLL